MDERFAEMNPKTCVVLGGRSFLGKSLVLRLLKLGKWIVRVADSAHSLQLDSSSEADSLLSQAISSDRASYHHVDVRDFSQIVHGMYVCLYYRYLHFCCLDAGKMREYFSVKKYEKVHSVELDVRVFLPSFETEILISVPVRLLRKCKKERGNTRLSWIYECFCEVLRPGFYFCVLHIYYRCLFGCWENERKEGKILMSGHVKKSARLSWRSFDTLVLILCFYIWLAPVWLPRKCEEGKEKKMWGNCVYVDTWLSWIFECCCEVWDLIFWFIVWKQKGDMENNVYYLRNISLAFWTLFGLKF